MKIRNIVTSMGITALGAISLIGTAVADSAIQDVDASSDLSVAYLLPYYRGSVSSDEIATTTAITVVNLGNSQCDVQVHYYLERNKRNGLPESVAEVTLDRFGPTPFPLGPFGGVDTRTICTREIPRKNRFIKCTAIASPEMDERAFQGKALILTQRQCRGKLGINAYLIHGNENGNKVHAVNKLSVINLFPVRGNKGD